MTHTSSLRRMRRPVADRMLGACGIVLATVSASFASYMIATAPPKVVGYGSKDFTIFAHWDKRGPRRPEGDGAPKGLGGPGPDGAPGTGEGSGNAPPAVVAAAGSVPAAPVAVASAVATTTAVTDGIDLTPTGTVAPAPAPAPAETITSARTLREFRVREVTGDHAVVEHGSRLHLVRPGSVLAGAGRVLGIERRGDAWVVRTAGGLIVDPPTALR